MAETRDFNKEAATWDENPARVKIATDVARAIMDTVRPDKAMDVLDFGAGTGLLSLAVQPHVHSITAIDSSPGMLAVLEEKMRKQGLTNVQTRVVDLGKGDAFDGRFDVIISSMTFHHISDVGSVLRKLAAALKPGGRIAIADLDSDDGKFHDSAEGVFHNGFDRCTMLKQFEIAGLTMIRNRTAAIVRKPSIDGEIRTFTLFLMTGKNPE